MKLGRDPPRDAESRSAADVRMSFTQQPGTAANWCDVGRVTIDGLPDITLLEIFDCYVNQEDQTIQAWHTLVHMCRKWRAVVFGSPLRLNLRLFCTEKTPVREMLAIWPPLPIIVRQLGSRRIDNIMAALEHNDRVCEITLWSVTSLELEEVLALMQKSYLALTDLSVSWSDDHGAPPIVPESFLGGSPPSLRHLSLNYIPFPAFPNLLLSPTHIY